jgi:hypothetical protein
MGFARTNLRRAVPCARLPDVALANGTMQKYKIRATDEIDLLLRPAIGA